MEKSQKNCGFLAKGEIRGVCERLTGADGVVVLEPVDDGRRIGVHFALDFVVRVTNRVLLSGGVFPGDGNF